MAQKVFEGALEELRQIVELLEQALSAWQPRQLLLIKLKKLHDDYKRTLDQDYLVDESLYELMNGHVLIKRFLDLARASEDAEELYEFLGQALSKAMNRTGSSIRAMQEKRPEVTRIYLDDALQWLRRALEKLRAVVEPSTPVQIGITIRHNFDQWARRGFGVTPSQSAWHRRV